MPDRIIDDPLPKPRLSRRSAIMTWYHEQIKKMQQQNTLQIVSVYRWGFEFGAEGDTTGPAHWIPVGNPQKPPPAEPPKITQVLRMDRLGAKSALREIRKYLDYLYTSGFSDAAYDLAAQLRGYFADCTKARL